MCVCVRRRDRQTCKYGTSKNYRKMKIKTISNKMEKNPQKTKKQLIQNQACSHLIRRCVCLPTGFLIREYSENLNYYNISSRRIN